MKAIQVDGGREFMAEFEAACQAKGVALHVLPPRRPQMNGAVERCNGTWRYEFSPAQYLAKPLSHETPAVPYVLIPTDPGHLHMTANRGNLTLTET